MKKLTKDDYSRIELALNDRQTSLQIQIAQQCHVDPSNDTDITCYLSTRIVRLLCDEYDQVSALRSKVQGLC